MATSNHSASLIPFAIQSRIIGTIGECTTSKLRHHCAQCGRLFSRRSHLSSHVRTHTGERPFQCRICKKGFTQSGSLYRHMRNHERIVNRNVTNMSCLQCCRVFLSKKGLTAHLRAGHKTMTKTDLLMIPVRSQSQPVESAASEWLPSLPLNEFDDISEICFGEKEQLVAPSTISNSGLPMPSISPTIEDNLPSHQQSQCMICWQTFPHESLLSEHIFNTHFKSPPVSPSTKARSVP